MKQKIVACAIAAVMGLSCVSALSACTENPKKNPQTVTENDVGMKRKVGIVDDPSSDVCIKVITNHVQRSKDASPVRMEGYGELDYYEVLEPEDMIEITSDYTYITLSWFDNVDPVVLYSPTGRFIFQVPDAPTSNVPQPYDYDATFKKASQHIEAHVSTAEEIATTRNLAVNPYDYVYANEVGNYTATTEQLINESPCLPDGTDELLTYPHAYANRVTENKPIFQARNAIDGVTTTGNNHYAGNYQSWGYGKNDDAELTVYFGREVSIDSLAFVFRSDFTKDSSGKEHDTYWESVKAEFSDGTEEVFTDFEKGGEKQERELGRTVVTSYVRLTGMQSVDSGKDQGWAALTEIEAYGSDIATKNQPATKIYTEMTFGKQQGTVTTNSYHADDIRTFIEGVFKYTMLDPDYGTEAGSWHNGSVHQDCYERSEHNRDGKTEDYGYRWQDGVMYVGMMDAYMTTGQQDILYFLRSIGDMHDWEVNNGNKTNHADYYIMGEMFMLLEQLDPTYNSYKLKHAADNAAWVIEQNAKTNTGFDYSSPTGSMNFWWCDALYMAMNTYTILAQITGKSEYVQAAFDGYNYWKDILYNEEYHLWNRDKATGEFEVKAPSGELAFWSRGNAWVLSALAKQLMYLDAAEYPEIYEQYQTDFVELATAIKNLQRDDGTWNSALCNGGWSGLDGKEITGTAGFLYSFSVGISLGILDFEEFFPATENAWTAISDTCVIKDDENGIKVGYMQTVGKRCDTYKNEAFSKNHTNTFGTGLVLMGASAFMRLCEDYTTPTVENLPEAQGSVIKTYTKA